MSHLYSRIPTSGDHHRGLMGPGGNGPSGASRMSAIPRPSTISRQSSFGSSQNPPSSAAAKLFQTATNRYGPSTGMSNRPSAGFGTVNRNAYSAAKSLASSGFSARKSMRGGMATGGLYSQTPQNMKNRLSFSSSVASTGRRRSSIGNAAERLLDNRNLCDTTYHRTVFAKLQEV